MGKHRFFFAILKLVLCSNRISLARSLDDIPKDENVVVQEYVDKVRSTARLYACRKMQAEILVSLEIKL